MLKFLNWNQGILAEHEIPGQKFSQEFQGHQHQEKFCNRNDTFKRVIGTHFNGYFDEDSSISLSKSVNLLGS